MNNEWHKSASTCPSTPVTSKVQGIPALTVGVLSNQVGLDSNALPNATNAVTVESLTGDGTTIYMVAVLQAHGRFGPPAAAPILLNLFQIVAAGLFVLGMIENRVTAAYVVGVAAMIASIAQVVWSFAGFDQLDVKGMFAGDGSDPKPMVLELGKGALLVDEFGETDDAATKVLDENKALRARFDALEKEAMAAAKAGGEPKKAPASNKTPALRMTADAATP